MTGSKPIENLRAYYPEIGAGGFSRVDGTIDFYLRINALLRPDMTVLDLGAGRGAQLQKSGIPFRTELQKLQGKVKRLVGVDVDDAILSNPFLDEAHVASESEPLPFKDNSFDLIYADWVLEHVQTPGQFAAETHRLLKPGGWFCARTPNRWGITGIGTNLLPNRWHAPILQRLQPHREVQDVFPTAYKLNTKSRLRRYFSAEQWEHYSYYHNPEPPYVQRSKLLLGLAYAFVKFAPQAMATNLVIVLRKR